MKAIGISVTVLIYIVASCVWRGYAFSKLWLWFIVSTFGAPQLSIAQSIGLTLVASFLCHQYDSYQDKDKSTAEKIGASAMFSFLSPALALLIGWIVKGFIA